MNSAFGFITQLFGSFALFLSIYDACAALPSTFLKSPYPGSRIISQQKSTYIDNMYLLLSKPRSKNNTAYVEKVEKLRGSLDTTVFSHRDSDSEIEIHESYKQALLKEGYTLKFVCPPGCYSQEGEADWDYVMGKYAPPVGDGVMPITNISYLAASKDNVSVMILAGGATSADPPISVVATVMSKTIDLSQVEIQKDFVSAAAIGTRMQQEGRVPVYGVYFDTGKADLKPQSRPVLNEIARFLKQNASTRLYVVGHTDDSGGYQNNLDLSDKRAAAVVADLIQHNGIDPARLMSRGVGPLAPLASNRTESGKSKNRRVELIEKLN